MILLDDISFTYQGQKRSIQIYQGDLTDLSPSEAVDFLIVSALPNDYLPTHSSLIGALHKKGVSLETLAQNKAEDLRQNFSCWLTHELTNPEPGIQFKRILCFEPSFEKAPPEVVGDIFQGMIPFLPDDGSTIQVAMPLVSTGIMSVPLADMLEPLVDATIQWMQRGLPLQTLKIVEISSPKALELKGAFSMLKRRYNRVSGSGRLPYDIFVSYSWKDMQNADFLIEELKRRRADLRIFLDRAELTTGSAWQQKIYDALDQCEKIVALYSPNYLNSKMCKEEFNIALYRQRESSRQILLPLYLHSADLPTYMKVVQYQDCREADHAKLSQATQSILNSLIE